jgi:hypothetical protein
MKNKKRTGLLCLLTLVIGCVLPLPAEDIVIPGDVSRISYYTNFFYNYPGQDFIYYLNDRLLYAEKPDEKVLERGLRNKLRKVILWHSLIKKFLQKSNPDNPRQISFDLADPKGFSRAKLFLKLLGLSLQKNEKGDYLLNADRSVGAVNYSKFDLINPLALQSKLNRTQKFQFKIKESRVPIPWELSKLEEITGKKLEATSFFEELIMDERLSLLLGVLYRLSDREIQYIGDLIPQPAGGAWKKIYEDKKLLMGMFVLSSALRVKENRLDLPGGAEADVFWSGLVGKDYREAPFDFLVQLATAEHGKWNYLYVFSYFLPADMQKILFGEPRKMQALCRLIQLAEEEKLTGSSFPGLRPFSFYTLMYALQATGDKVNFPGGLLAWMEPVRLKYYAQFKNESAEMKAASDASTVYDLLWLLLKVSSLNKNGMGEMQKFISIYSKFYPRPELLNKETIAGLYNMYENYNVLVDFAEKIPFKKPETISKSFSDLVLRLDELDKDDLSLFSSLIQSVFELFSQQAKYIPADLSPDYDRMVAALLDISMDRSVFYDRFFQYLERELKIPLKSSTADDAFMDFILRGIPNRTLHIQDASYRFIIKNVFKQTLQEILASQEIGSLGMLLEINRMLERIRQGNAEEMASIRQRLFDLFNVLPNPGISDNAPRSVRDRFKPYSRTALNRDLQHLVNKSRNQSPPEALKKLVSEIKTKYLIYHLRDYLLAHAYALNAKNLDLKSFLNPNLVRLHDFEGEKGQTPWNFTAAQRRGDTLLGFHLKGGLSRLNIDFAANLNDHLFGRNYIYNAHHIQAVIVNLLDFYPIPGVNHSQTYTALLVKFALELIEQAKTNEDIRHDLCRELPTITAGFHYRKAMQYMDRLADNHNLFFSELLQIGRRFFWRGEYLNGFSEQNKLTAYSRDPLAEVIGHENHRFGSIYSHTFGTLTPRQMPIFPQEVANLFDSGWIGGEMIDEFKVKVAYHAYRKKISSYLSGQVLYQFLFKTCRQFYSQNHSRDYYSTYFVFDIFNSSYLNKTIKKLNQRGHLRIQ